VMEIKSLIDPRPVPSPLVQSPWFVMLTEPQQDLTTVCRLHELGLEHYVPLLRRRVKTGRIGRNGQKVTRVIAKPTFPGYSFLRTVVSPVARVAHDHEVAASNPATATKSVRCCCPNVMQYG
jgi:hypothetical protein